MAVIKAKQEKIVPFFLELLQREQLLSMLITRIGGDQFKGALGDTVTLRTNERLTAVARQYTWRTRPAPIVLDDITGFEDGIPIKLDTHLYSATGLTDEHMTLDEIQFAQEVLQPQAEAVGREINARCLAAFRAADWKQSFTVAAGIDPHRVAVEARRRIDSDKVAPQGGRVFLIGSDIAAEWLVSDRLSKYDWNGQTGTPALREATIGQLAGTPVVVNNELNPDEAYYFHKGSLVVANLAPVVPQGAAAGRTGVNAAGFAARWLQDYDAAYLTDRSIVSSFVGISEIKDERKGGNGVDANDLLEDPNARNNVRGLKITYTGTGSVID
jgi:P22 coat protein - gene protein 5